MKKNISFLIYIFLNYSICYSIQDKLNVNKKNGEFSIFLQKCLEPVKFTSSGVQLFIKQMFKNEEYKDFLANNFTHLIQFLKYGFLEKKSNIYIKYTFDLFNQKIKSSNYINPYAYSKMLNELPALLEERFIEKKISIFEKIKDIFCDFLLSKFSFFKKETEGFIDDLAGEVSSFVADRIDEKIEIEQLRHVIIRFLEVGLNKLIWSPEDGMETWKLVKTIAEQLTKLAECNIIDNLEDLNSLYWSLLLRFCNFIDLTGSCIPLEVYEEIRDDIESKTLFFLELDFQMNSFEKKSEVLLRTVYNGVFKNYAREHGLVADFD